MSENRECRSCGTVYPPLPSLMAEFGVGDNIDYCFVCCRDEDIQEVMEMVRVASRQRKDKERFFQGV